MEWIIEEWGIGQTAGAPKNNRFSKPGVSIVFMAPGDEIVIHNHPYEEAYFIWRVKVK
jgi:quercetin dioxygenase-like cupin family protein